MLNLFLDHKFLLLPFLLVYIFCCLLICSSSRKDHLNVAGGVCVRINLIINSVNPEAYLGGAPAFLCQEGIWSQGINPLFLLVARTLIKDLRQKDHCFYIKTNPTCSRVGSHGGWSLRRVSQRMSSWHSSGLCHRYWKLMGESGEHKVNWLIRGHPAGPRACPESPSSLCVPAKLRCRRPLPCGGYPEGLPFGTTLFVHSSLFHLSIARDAHSRLPPVGSGVRSLSVCHPLIALPLWK